MERGGEDTERAGRPKRGGRHQGNWGEGGIHTQVQAEGRLWDPPVPEGAQPHSLIRLQPGRDPCGASRSCPRTIG
jgi:hypothetical protein